MLTTPVSIFWFRRDLRLEDNHGLYQALKSGYPVLPIFIFDREILDKLGNKKDARVQFIHEALHGMQDRLAEVGSSMNVFYGCPKEIWKKIIKDYQVEGVYTNHDYEPYAAERDSWVEGLCKEHGIGFHSYKDQVIFEKSEVLSGSGGVYTVFTPYSKKWKATLDRNTFQAFNSEGLMAEFVKMEKLPIPSLEVMGFVKGDAVFPAKTVADSLVAHYDTQRNFPALPATSRLGVHLRFGTISIRSLASKASGLNETFLNELIWRDFYQMLLFHFPHSATRSFKPEYDRVEWVNDEAHFAAWCEGRTGYPIVDAGMKELNATGFMHNRVRMITASFLCKSLLIDWRWGEAYFAEKLLDYDMASNVGGWQWAASSGADASPYFRIFNPALQQDKFDKDYKYVKKWVPDFNTSRYPLPIIDHAFARARALAAFEKAVKKNGSVL